VAGKRAFLFGSGSTGSGSRRLGRSEQREIMQQPNRSRTIVWKPLVVCPEPDFQRRLHAVFTELAVEQPCTLTEYPRSGTIAALAEGHACNVCFLDVATNSEDAQRLISELAPVVPVVALHPRNDADLILRCLRRGASEFVADPTADAVRGVFERLAHTRYEGVQQAPGAVYCVVPASPAAGRARWPPTWRFTCTAAARIRFCWWMATT